jgi:hypothetical protein
VQLQTQDCKVKASKDHDAQELARETAHYVTNKLMLVLHVLLQHWLMATAVCYNRAWLGTALQYTHGTA